MKPGWIQIGPDRWRGPLPCPTGKMPFWELREAEARAAKVNRENIRSAVPARAYACKKCGLHHIGRPWKEHLEQQAAMAEYMKTRFICPHCKKQFGRKPSFDLHLISSACANALNRKRLAVHE